jgi:hypothetical protein
VDVPAPAVREGVPVGELRRSRAAAALCAAAAALVSALVVAVGLAGPARADDGALRIDVPGDGLGFVHSSTVPILHDLRLAPGYSTSGTFEVLDDSAYDVSLELRTTDVVQAEGDCLRQEVAAGDTSCTGSGGELGDWLEVTVSKVTDAGDRQLWTGPFAALADGVDLEPGVAAGEVATLRIAVTLPRAATNDTMSDSVSFGLRLDAQAVAGGLAGARTGPGASVTGATMAVVEPAGRDDGVHVEPLLLGAELLLGLSAIALFVARRRHQGLAVRAG